MLLIEAHGWLRAQLVSQAKGLGGALHKVWADVRDSQWRGGAGEGWERVPYWLDYLVPLAYGLRDGELTAVVDDWLAYILQQQHDDGWFGPVHARDSYPDTQPLERDPWPQFVLCKALTQWHDCLATSPDERLRALRPRVVAALRRAVDCIGRQLADHPLHTWAQMRWFELAVTIDWLIERSSTDEKLRLADVKRLLAAQGYDWSAHFAAERFPAERAEDWRLDNHGVNHAMAVKEPLFRGSDAVQAAKNVLHAIALLNQYHGQANGMFSCDESLAGRAPYQGTECCTVVEYLYSLEYIYTHLSIQSSQSTFISQSSQSTFISQSSQSTLIALLRCDLADLADIFERVVFNALPAGWTKDSWAHQYVQQVNQVMCIDAVDQDQVVYTTNGPRANLFGLEPNFGCCTANQQGWPKAAAHLWCRVEAERPVFRALSLCPCAVRCGDVHFRVQTHYPFDERVYIYLLAGDAVELHVPVPYWSPSLLVDERPLPLPADRTLVVSLTQERPRVALRFAFDVRVEDRPPHAVAVYVGPLLFGLRLSEEVRPDGPEPYADRQVVTASPWNYALDLNFPFKLLRRPVAAACSPFAAPPALTVLATARLDPLWRVEKSAAAAIRPIADASQLGPPTEVQLVPYGSTLLRVAEFPYVAAAAAKPAASL